MKKNTFRTAAAGIAAGFSNGLLGAGGGMLLVPTLERLLGVPTRKAHATAIAVILPLSVCSALIYARGGGLDLKALLGVCAGGAVGGYVGAKCLMKIPKRMLHKLFAVFMLAAAARMIL